MPTLTERLDVSIANLVTEKQRIKTQADSDLAAVDSKLTIMRTARRALTADVEAAYTALRDIGMFKEF